MRIAMRTMSLLCLAATLSACSTGPQPGPSPQAQRDLQRLLAGKVPGKPIACLPDSSTRNLVVIDDHTVAYKDGRTVYVNNFRGGTCSNLNTGFHALVTRRFGGADLCSGDIAQVLDTTSGFIVGSCVMGDFVPYKPVSG
jgi:hypothetical protein